MRLGLKDLVRVRRLDVFVEIDPAHSMYRGYRRSESFYTVFAGKVLEGVLKRMPELKEVRIDGYPSVSPAGPLVRMLVDVAQGKNKRVLWADALRIGQVEEKHKVSWSYWLFYIRC